jgi:hypothetical protein
VIAKPKNGKYRLGFLTFVVSDVKKMTDAGYYCVANFAGAGYYIRTSIT